MNYSERYDHDFSSCSRAYATLCIYHDMADPQTISDALQLTPDNSQKCGDIIRPGKTVTASGWFLGTKDVLESKDIRAHIDWILDKLSPNKNGLQKLFDLGYKMRIWCFWASSSGNGGPILDHDLIKRLSEYPLDMDFDIWFES